MQSCCVRGCDSYKEASSKNIGYFKFPLNDVFLLKKWLRQINRPGWEPSERSQICSAHFRESDFQRVPSQKLFFLMPYSVPTIFPISSRKLAIRKRKIEETAVEERRREAMEGHSVPHRNKVSLLRRNPKSVTGSETNVIGEHGDAMKTENLFLSPVEMISLGTLKRDKPVLRITVKKKVNLPASSASKPQPFETIYLPYHDEKEDNSGIVKVKDDKSSVWQLDDMEIVKIDQPRAWKPCSEYSQMDDMEIVKVEDPRSSKQPKDHSSHIRSKNSRLQKESKDLGKRLEELRERRKEEQLKIARLQMDLVEVEKKMKENNSEEIVVPNLGSGGKAAGTRNKSNWLLKEKEEYENLLKDVREIKLRVLRERHDRELDKIRRLQAQMISLREKMKENDEKEIALSNMRSMSNAVSVRPDWMKREEEEYEKLLEDVRKIKEIYRLRRKPKDENFGSTETNPIRFKTEKIISDEDCVIIEAMQKNDSKLDDRDNDEYGEVIGEIDEDSVDINIAKKETISFNDELSDPGLIDA